MDYQLEGVWPSPSQAVQNEVVSFWLAEAAFEATQADYEFARQAIAQIAVLRLDLNIDFATDMFGPDLLGEVLE